MAILAVLEAILAILETSWRPSWAILAVLGAILAVLEASWPSEGRKIPVFKLLKV